MAVVTKLKDKLLISCDCGAEIIITKDVDNNLKTKTTYKPKKKEGSDENEGKQEQDKIIQPPESVGDFF